MNLNVRPFCQERIRAEAIKCRFCGEWLDRSRKEPEQKSDAQLEGNESYPEAHSLTGTPTQLRPFKGVSENSPPDVWIPPSKGEPALATPYKKRSTRVLTAIGLGIG